MLLLSSKVVSLFFKQRRRVMSTFVSRMNPVTGKLDWIVQNEDYDFQQEVARQVMVVGKLWAWIVGSRPRSSG